jgi:flagellar biosynthesis/type III secretory pathway protein FliH
MKELSLSFGHFKREDELPLTIIVNGCTYQSQPLVDATKKTYFEMGKREATLERVDQFNKGYEIGKYDGYEQCKHDGISKINLNTEPVEQTELSKEYDKGFTKGYEEGKSESYAKGWNNGYESASIKYFDEYSVKLEEKYNSGYDAGKKSNGISKKEIRGEYLSHIEEAYDDGYKEGYTDCREVAKMLNKYGIDEDGPCNDCKEEPGRDEDGPEQTEYAKGYEDGRMDIMQFIGNNRG